MGVEVTDAAREIEKKLKTMAEDTGLMITRMYNPWNNDEPFIDPEDHLVSAVRSSPPNAGDLDEGAVAMGEGTGPNGRDELFFSTDGNTVARVEADSIIS
jgi:hypothetical protein